MNRRVICAGVCLVVSFLSAPAHAQPSKELIEYKVLATNKTSTMQKEMPEAGDAGYEYRGQTVFKTMFGGKEVVVILERKRRLLLSIKENT